MLLKEYRIGCMIEGCVFCKRKVPTRGHHVVPRCKGGTETAPTCHSCEDFIHKTWSHKELRDAFNTVEKILGRSTVSKIPPVALQAAAKRVLSNAAKPVQNQPALPLISGFWVLAVFWSP